MSTLAILTKCPLAKCHGFVTILQKKSWIRACVGGCHSDLCLAACTDSHLLRAGIFPVFYYIVKRIKSSYLREVLSAGEPLTCVASSRLAQPVIQYRHFRIPCRNIILYLYILYVWIDVCGYKLNLFSIFGSPQMSLSYTPYDTITQEGIRPS